MIETADFSLRDGECSVLFAGGHDLEAQPAHDARALGRMFQPMKLVGTVDQRAAQFGI